MILFWDVRCESGGPGHLNHRKRCCALQLDLKFECDKNNRGERQVSHTYHWIGPVRIVLTKIVFITDRFCPMTSQYWSGYIMSGTVVTLPLSPLTMALNLPSSQLIKLYLPSWLNFWLLNKQIVTKHWAVSRNFGHTLNSIFWRQVH